MFMDIIVEKKQEHRMDPETKYKFPEISLTPRIIDPKNINSKPCDLRNCIIFPGGPDATSILMKNNRSSNYSSD